MRLLARLAVLTAFAVSVCGCGSGNGGSLPFAGPPNNAGGAGSTLQSGGTGSALLRFVQGSPDFAAVDVCIDSLAVASGSTNIGYLRFSPAPLAITAGIAHTLAVYTVPTGPGTGPGTECPTAPGPYFGSAAIAVTTFAPAANTRSYVVLGGTAAGATLGLYFYPAAASFVNAPTSPQAQAFNASPTFGPVGLGYVLPAPGVPTNLAASLVTPARSTATSTVVTGGSFALAALPAQPASFYVGKAVTSGTVVPITTVPAVAAVPGTTYVADVFSVDAPAGGVTVVSIAEPTTGYGF